jgi:pyruvate/2-oxoacid:ferredoxin oxidoreductase alpha subunit
VRQVLTGNEAVAIAAKLARVRVVAAYPITPQTVVVEKLAEFVADGELDAEFMKVESEHSALSACIGASAVGARAFTATSSQGLMLMSEMLFIAAGLRLPIVVANANRALSAPLNIWCFTKDAEVLMGDLTYKPISEIKEGDIVLGKDKNGNLRFTKVKRLFKRETDDLIELKTDKFNLICTPDHRFYYHPAHGHWIRARSLKNKLLPWFGFGYSNETDEFKRGWLSGVADGDGCLWRDEQGRDTFRINVKDEVIIDTFIKYCSNFGFDIRKVNYRKNEGLSTGIITLARETTRLKEFLNFSKNADFCRGYLAGIYDAEGSGPSKVKQAVIYNSNPEILKKIFEALDLLGMKYRTYVDKRSMNHHIKINNVPEFFIRCRPVLERKRNNLCKMSIRSVKSRLKIENIIPIRENREVYNLETDTNNYIVNGFLVHNCDQQDSFAVRDSGCIQIYCEDNQEILDSIIQAYRVAEELLLPVMVCYDGYILSHTAEPVDVPEQAEVDEFLPPYKHPHPLDPDKPVTMGPVGVPEYYEEFRYMLQQAMCAAKKHLLRVDKEFGKRFGRSYGLLERYRSDDADVLLLTAGSVSSSAKELIDRYRERGEHVGLVKVRAYRPFPGEELVEALGHAKAVAVLEKDISLGWAGALFTDVSAAFANEEKAPLMMDFICGLGGRDVSPVQIREALRAAAKAAETGEVKRPVRWLGLREKIVGLGV